MSLTTLYLALFFQDTMSNHIETIFKKSNSVLFEDTINLSYNKQIKDIMISRVNLARSMKITDANNSEFDKLISSLEYSLENSDDLMALSLIGKVNQTLISVAESFQNLSSLFNKLK